MLKAKLRESVMRGVFILCACISILAVALICVFLFANGIPAFKEIGLWRFLSGALWRPSTDVYGIAPMIMGSSMCAGRLIIASNRILTRCFSARFCPERFTAPQAPVTSGGIPLRV